MQSDRSWRHDTADCLYYLLVVPALVVCFLWRLRLKLIVPLLVYYGAAGVLFGLIFMVWSVQLTGQAAAGNSTDFFTAGFVSFTVGALALFFAIDKALASEGGMQ